jgi:GTP cyclohydrolase FolE2
LPQPELFQRAKLQKNESQSQLHRNYFCPNRNCFKEQNYKKMKANHNYLSACACANSLFQRAKLQKNESQSQRSITHFANNSHCFKEQNYKKMKANHNFRHSYKTTPPLFQRAKLQKNESQSQQCLNRCYFTTDCFKEQNYKKMKANHN